MGKTKENIKSKFKIERDLQKELLEIEKILKSDEPDDLKFRSIRVILDELSEEIVDAKINAMFESRTGLLSARFGEEALEREVEQTKRNNENFTIALLDIDFLKYINDTFGHVVGTKVIIEVAQSLKKLVRRYDILCRYGGDEFLIIFPNTNIKKAEKVVKRIKRDIEKKRYGKKVKVTISYGLSGCCGKAKKCSTKPNTSTCMLEEADKELYKSKRKRVNVNLK